MAGAILERLQAERRELVGNEPLVLGTSSFLVLIESGSLALYCAEVKNGVQTGPRRFLQRIGSGQAVISVPGEPFERLGLLVVPVREATVRIVPLDTLWADEEARSALAAPGLVDGWATVLASFLADLRAPRLVARPPVQEVGQARLKLSPTHALGAEPSSVVWCEALSGELACVGRDDQRIGPGAGLMPLAGGLWVAIADARVDGAEGEVDGVGLRLCVTERLETADALAGGLRRLQGLVFDHIRAQIERETEEELARLSKREELQAEKTQAALEELAAVFEPRDSDVREKTPLLTAVAAIGKALGVKVRAPQKSEQAVLGGRTDPVDAIARASRLRHRRIALHGKWWTRDAGPLLAFTDDAERRPVALLPDKFLRYDVFDPVTRTRQRLTRNLARGLAPEGVVFYRPFPEGKVKLKDLLAFTLLPRKRDLWLITIAGIIATLLGMLIPQVTALVMDSAIPDANQRLLMQLGLGLMAATLGNLVFRLSQGIVLARLGMATEALGQAAVWDRLLRLRPSFFRRFSSGDLASRVGAISEIGRQLSGVTLGSLFSGMLAMLNLGLLFYYSARLAVVAILIALGVMLFTFVVGTLIRRKYKVLLELEGVFFGLVIQLITAVGKLRVAGAAERAFTHWVSRYTSQVKLRFDIQRLTDVSTAFQQLLPPLSSVVLYLLAFDMLVAGRVPGHGTVFTLGTFLAFHTAFGSFLGGCLSLSSTLVGLQDLAILAKRVQPILEAEPEIDEEKQDPGKLTGRITLDDVSFSYEEDGPRILDEVSLHAEPGEFVAIVGPSGSGKSTIFRLILGFERPDEGVVSFDGQDLASLDVGAVRRQLGVVLQGGRLDAGSIFENISSGNVITLDEAWAAAEAAGFADEVRNMPMGMHTILSVGGGNLSGGQRQRLLIARALAHRPKILLFDEATSALDNRTQAIVSESLERLQVTRLVVAHRMSTIRGADRIFVVDAGRVVQSGTFDELMAQADGLFARMMKRQVA